MLCANGTQLLKDYQKATKERADARDELLIISAHPMPDDHLFAAKRQYSKAFIAWVTHRSLCVSCRAVHGKNDQAQFASL